MTAPPDLVERARQLHVERLGPQQFRVTGGERPHLVDLSNPIGERCDCRDCRSRRRDCKHTLAAQRYDPQAALLDAMTDEQVLDALDSSRAQEPRRKPADPPRDPLRDGMREATTDRLTRIEAHLVRLEAQVAERMPGTVRRWWRTAGHVPPAAPAPPTELKRWRAELAAGKRTPTTFDDLWREACEELNAIEVRGRCR